MKKLSKEDIHFIKRAFKYIKAYKGKTAFMISIAIIAIVLEMFQPLLFGKIVDNITRKEINQIRYYLVILILLVIGDALLNYLQNILSIKISNAIQVAVRNNMFQNFIKIEYKEHLHIRKGEFIEKIDQDSKAFADLLLQSISSITSDIFEAVLIGVIIFSINIKLSIILITFFPINLITYKYYGEKLRKINLKYKTHKDQYLSFINEVLSGFKMIKIFQAERLFQTRHINKIRDITNVKIDAAYIYSENEILIKFINLVGYSIIILLGVYEIFKNEITLGQFVSFNSYSATFTASLFALAKLNSKVQEALVSVERVFSIIDSYSNKKEKKYTETEIDFNNDIEMKDVCFSYDNEMILKHLNLKIKAKQINAIVGPSGCGKSTLLDIIMGIYDHYTGSIQVGQSSYEKINRQKLFEKIVLVNQEEFLISGTIRENLLLGNDKIDENKMIEKCKMVDIHNFIMSLPCKYDTLIGENGTKVSIGQKQKLGIARALMKGADVYLFDEITSALDGESEEYIIDIMKKLSENATVVLVSHKPKTVFSADNIIVLNEGKIEKLGDQDYIIKKSSIFNSIFGRA